MKNMNKTIATIPQNKSARDPRYSALPVKDILTIRLKDLGLKNTDLQKALGYDYPNVIAMMKTGSMRLPPSKAVIAARLLKIDPIFLLGKVIAENDPDLWDAISSVMADQLVTANELELIRLVRQGLDGHDVNLTQSPALVEAVNQELKEILERQNALALAAINRVDD
jgi:hypothetical protein